MTSVIKYKQTINFVNVTRQIHEGVYLNWFYNQLVESLQPLLYQTG